MHRVVDVQNNKGQTPLRVSCAEGHLEVVELLIEYRADVNAVDATGATPLHLATMCGHARIIDYLIKAGCDTTICDNEGFTASMRRVI